MKKRLQLPGAGPIVLSFRLGEPTAWLRKGVSALTPRTRGCAFLHLTQIVLTKGSWRPAFRVRALPASIWLDAGSFFPPRGEMPDSEEVLCD